MPTFLFSATVFFSPTHAGKCSFKGLPLPKSRNPSQMGGGLYMHLWMFSSPISGVYTSLSLCCWPIEDKSSLRHKVKPIELIFSPPKNSITFCFAEHVFQQPSHKTLVSYGRKSNILQFNNKWRSWSCTQGLPFIQPSHHCGHIAQDSCSFQRNLPEFTANNFDWQESVWEAERKNETTWKFFLQQRKVGNSLCVLKTTWQINLGADFRGKRRKTKITYKCTDFGLWLIYLKREDADITRREHLVLKACKGMEIFGNTKRFLKNMHSCASRRWKSKLIKN